MAAAPPPPPPPCSAASWRRRCSFSACSRATPSFSFLSCLRAAGRPDVWRRKGWQDSEGGNRQPGSAPSSSIRPAEQRWLPRAPAPTPPAQRRRQCSTHMAFWLYFCCSSALSCASACFWASTSCCGHSRRPRWASRPPASGGCRADAGQQAFKLGFHAGRSLQIAQHPQRRRHRTGQLSCSASCAALPSTQHPPRTCAWPACNPRAPVGAGQQQGTDAAGSSAGLCGRNECATTLVLTPWVHCRCRQPQVVALGSRHWAPPAASCGTAPACARSCAATAAPRTQRTAPAACCLRGVGDAGARGQERGIEGQWEVARHRLGGRPGQATVPAAVVRSAPINQHPTVRWLAVGRPGTHRTGCRRAWPPAPRAAPAPPAPAAARRWRTAPAPP